MNGTQNLTSTTNTFFQRHWHLDTPPPDWDDNWDWQGAVPNHRHGGLYALFDSTGNLVYVGLGASLGGGQYREFGISRRLLQHVLEIDYDRGDTFYKPKAKWEDVTAIATLGFEPELTYLAPALEDFLIRELKPSHNIMKKPA